MIRALLVFAALGTAAPVFADPNPQLVASVQSRLNKLGFRDVDASTLSTQQIAALHMRLQGPRFGGIGPNSRWHSLRGQVRVILDWDNQRNSL